VSPSISLRLSQLGTGTSGVRVQSVSKHLLLTHPAAKTGAIAVGDRLLAIICPAATSLREGGTMNGGGGTSYPMRLPSTPSHVRLQRRHTETVQSGVGNRKTEGTTNTHSINGRVCTHTGTKKNDFITDYCVCCLPSLDLSLTHSHSAVIHYLQLHL
jgi:hypothetical protein